MAPAGPVPHLFSNMQRKHLLRDPQSARLNTFYLPYSFNQFGARASSRAIGKRERRVQTS